MTETQATVRSVQQNLVAIDVPDGRIMKNEVGFIHLGKERLMCEVLRVTGHTADMQVFEDTSRVSAGVPVELTGHLLSASLGPGLLGTVYDGLQNPLHAVAAEHGFFLPRGAVLDKLDPQREWPFSPAVQPGDTVRAGQVLGTTPEVHLEHRVMTPFALDGNATVTWVHEGDARADTVIARLAMPDGRELDVRLAQPWPVRRPVPEDLLHRRLVERVYPSRLLTTTQRIIDTFFPIAQGGMACIPGPFGAGKTVLQSLISRYSNVDIVVIVACGERAGEVVETITEFPTTPDPRTGGTLMDRTVILCNTSAMPVAAREASIYTGVTIGEYYRAMGYNVLLIADSTSRWAQAMREISGRLEEIPGEEAFPAYLDSSIKSVYERAGVIRDQDGRTGSLTIIGTVSPAGGNFDEPVTQATLATVKTFLGLSSERAYKRCYPAIDPLISWSRYLHQLQPWMSEHLSPDWVDRVQRMRELIARGDSVFQMIQVTGEEGISLDDFVVWQKAEMLDTVYLQQDAFDDVDVSMPQERQLASFTLVVDLLERTYTFSDKDAARTFFTQLMSLYRNYNFAEPGSREHEKYRAAVLEKADEQTA